jgi:adenylosuccinate lyase
MTLLAAVQSEFGLIPAQAAAEIKIAYENLEIDEVFLKEASEGFVKTNHSLMGLINAVKNRCGRMHGQPGLPITFGFKAATWLDELERHRQRLSQLKSRLGGGQLGGGVGSLSTPLS